MLHGYFRVDGRDADLALSKVLHDHIARKHRSDLVIGRQSLVRQCRITRAKNPILTKINVELLLHRRRDIDLGENPETLGFE